MELEGRTALITGCATGIGRSIAVEGLRAGGFMIPTHSHLVEFARARIDELTEATQATRFEPGT